LIFDNGVVATIKKGLLTVFVLHKSKEQISMNTPSINPPESKYKIRNRQAYNTGLSKRGSLTLFLSDELLKERSSPVSGKQAVGELWYPQGILQCCLLIRLNCRLPCRQSAGFLKSLFRLTGKESLPVPDYTTLCRRQKTLPVEISRYLQCRENPVAGTDSTGLKVCEVQGYHQRSLNETVMFRYKTIFGGELKARMAANQTAEVILKCLLLNTFRETGMPDFYKVA
jgi:hypothetical protein